MKFISNFFYLLLNSVSALLLLFIYVVPNGVVRTILAIPFLLFISGYVWVGILFPRRTTLNGAERVVLSITLSIIIIILTGLILNFTPWGINLNSIVIALTSVVLLGSLVAFYLQTRLSSQERIQLTIQSPLFKRGSIGLVLSLLLIIVVVSSVGLIGYHLINPNSSEKYTDFYLLDENGKVFNYPVNVKLGQNVIVTIGLVNKEQEETEYSVEVLMNGTKISDIGTIQLNSNQTWEDTYSYIATKLGTDERLDFVLYKDQSLQPYLNPLYIWFNVTAS